VTNTLGFEEELSEIAMSAGNGDKMLEGAAVCLKIVQPDVEREADVDEELDLETVELARREASDGAEKAICEEEVVEEFGGDDDADHEEPVHVT